MALSPKTPLERAELDAFSRKLNELMARQGMSQSDLARAVWGSTIDPRGRDTAKNRDRISHYTRGSQLPEARTMKLLATALGVDPTELSPSRSLPSTPGSAREVSLTTIGGRSDVALVSVNKMLPMSYAVRVLALLAEADEFMAKNAL